MVNGSPLVVVCTSRSGRLEPLAALFGRQGLGWKVVADRNTLEDLLLAANIHLLLIDAQDPGLALGGLLDTLTAHGQRRFVPVLVVGVGADAERVRQRLSGQLAVRVVDLGDAGREASRHQNQSRGEGSPIRRHVRVPVRMSVRLLPHEGETRTARTHDLSEEGMGLVSSDDLPEETSLHAEFRLPGDDDPLRLPALVRRRVCLAGGGYFLGLWFQDVTAAARDRLRSFVDRELPAVTF